MIAWFNRLKFMFQSKSRGEKISLAAPVLASALSFSLPNTIDQLTRSDAETPESIPYTEFAKRAHAGEIDEIFIDEKVLTHEIIALGKILSEDEELQKTVRAHFPSDEILEDKLDGSPADRTQNPHPVHGQGNHLALALALSLAYYQFAHRRATRFIDSKYKPKSAELHDQEAWRTAVHEAGHGIAMLHKEHDLQQEIKKITIRPANFYLGAVFHDPVKDHCLSFTSLKADIVADYAGLFAERAVVGADNESHGATSDLKKLTSKASSAVKIYGHSSNLVTANYNILLQENPSPELSNKVNSAIENILEECSADAEAILKEREADLIRLARKLVQVKEMTGDEVKAFLASDEEPPIAPGEAHFQGKKQPAPEPEIT